MKKNDKKDTAPGAPIAWESPSQPEEVQPGYGYVADNNESEETFYYHSDHLGSTSYITDDSARVTQYTAYLPYGELLVDEHSSSEDMPYKFNGKELDEETGLYYYGARYMQPTVGLFLNPDRYREKYPYLSAYNYCAGNPINMIDVNGDSVVISGKQLNEALKQLQDIVGKKLSLSINNDGYLCYTINNKRLNKKAQYIIEMIDDKCITVNLKTRDDYKTSTGNLFIGGAFMGNNVIVDNSGKVVRVIADQEINTSVLSKADKCTQRGTFIMHELSEAYQGAKISSQIGKSSPNAKSENSVYAQAHDKATYQPPVFMSLYNDKGQITMDQNVAIKAEWFVIDTNKNKIIIQTFP